MRTPNATSPRPAARTPSTRACGWGRCLIRAAARSYIPTGSVPSPFARERELGPTFDTFGNNSERRTTLSLRQGEGTRPHLRYISTQVRHRVPRALAGAGSAGGLGVVLVGEIGHVAETELGEQV